jgi:hypothetical protein
MHALLTEGRDRSFTHAASGGRVTTATWSRAARRTLLAMGPLLDDLPAPSLARIDGLETYDYTYTTDPARCDRRLRAHARQIAAALYRLRTPRRLVLLEDMLFDTFDGPRLHRLLSVCRHHLARWARDGRRALHTPPSLVGKTAGDFPLHSDLYLGEMLFIVFDDVSDRGDDHALFLPVAHLRRTVRKAPTVEGQRLLRCYHDPPSQDRFDEAYKLLHRNPTMNRWYRQHILPAAFRTSLARGRGYLLHDRTWMHGRELPPRHVTHRRFQRLVFDNASMGARR